MLPHPEFDAASYRNDIALIRLARPVVAVAPVALYRERDEQGRRVVFVGQGFSGTGETGAQRGPSIRRAAENRVETATEQWLRFVFDAPPAGLELEGISGPGDSGGPAFIDTAAGPQSAGGSGAPGRIRTADASLRTAALYPLSYGGVRPSYRSEPCSGMARRAGVPCRP